ncbi:hypothetical protein [Micromonospora sp. NPDC023644]|uniref:hypothetical protein n=1 Tax=Micromonospora sp. NPDC023644 TaxID=3154321 RepID=UPI0033E3C3DC
MTIIITEGPTAKALGHTDYERHRRRQIAYGRWNRWVDPAPVREHILALRRRGIGRDTLARNAGVTEHTIRRILGGKTTKVHVTCARKLLAVTNPQMPYVDATGSRRRLQALGTLGWDQSTLSARIGWSVGNLNLIVSGRRKNVTPATADLIHQLYEELSPVPAPAGYPASRAKVSARRHGWAPPLAWDDIDDPNEQPNLGGPDTDELVDEVAVRRALEGDRVRLTEAERVHAFRIGLKRGMTATAIGTHLRLSGGHARRIVRQLTDQAA